MRDATGVTSEDYVVDRTRDDMLARATTAKSSANARLMNTNTHPDGSAPGMRVTSRSPMPERANAVTLLMKMASLAAEASEFLASQGDVLESSAESMGAWQTYVQALVLANEFLYAD